MSKSTGNYILPLELLSGENTFFEKKFQPNVVRFCFLQAHYRSVLDISNEAMMASEKGLFRLLEGVKLLENISSHRITSFSVPNWLQSCYDAMNDDFNTPILIANLFEGIKYVNLINDGKETISSVDLDVFSKTIHSFLFDVLGLKNETETASNTEKLEGVINMLITMRNEARANKDFAMSDQIRDQLIALGIQLKDGKEGTTFSVQ